MENIILTNDQIEEIDFHLAISIKEGYGYYEISRDYITIGLAQGILLNSKIIKKVLDITKAEAVYIQNNEIIFVLTLKGASLRINNNAKPKDVDHKSFIPYKHVTEPVSLNDNMR